MDDEELRSSARSRGYRRLADFMAWDPSVAIFYKFRAANALNLLGLQAEISRLESKLLQTTIGDENQTQDPVKKRYQYDWTSLQDGEGGNSQQRQLILELRERLNEYNTALVQQITINQQASPSKRSLETLREWTEDIYGLASDLRGPGSRIVFKKEGGEYKLNDNIAIWPEGSGRDGFTTLIFKALTLFNHSRIPSYLSYFFWNRKFPAFQPDPLQQSPLEDRDLTMYLDSGAVVRAGDKIVTVISCLLVTVPVIVLHYVTNTGIRLGLIVVFALLFSLALVSTSDASRKEIFAATAAFVAVQVVYVGSAGGA